MVPLASHCGETPCFGCPRYRKSFSHPSSRLATDLEWKVLYVGSAKDASRDQILDEILVGPVPVGVNKFVLQADAPDPTKLATEDLLGVTVVLVTCSYREREFCRVGYYVNNEYHDPNAPSPPPVAAGAAPGDGSGGSGDAAGEPPSPPPLPNPIPIEHIQRQILADKPRVTKFPISWGDEDTTLQQQPQQSNPAAMESHQQSQHHDASGVVSMQEESNASFPSVQQSGVQAMME